MTDKKSNDSRRKLLKSIAAGSGAVVAGKTLPESWSKPVIDTVLLPAHALTSGGDYFGSFYIDTGKEEVLFKLCVQCVGSNCSAKATEAEKYYYEGTGSLGADMILTQLTDCDDYTVKLKIEEVNGFATGQFALRNGDGETELASSFSIPRAACGLSAADDHCGEKDEEEAKSEGRR